MFFFQRFILHFTKFNRIPFWSRMGKNRRDTKNTSSLARHKFHFCHFGVCARGFAKAEKQPYNRDFFHHPKNSCFGIRNHLFEFHRHHKDVLCRFVCDQITTVRLVYMDSQTARQEYWEREFGRRRLRQAFLISELHVSLHLFLIHIRNCHKQSRLVDISEFFINSRIKRLH